VYDKYADKHPSQQKKLYTPLSFSPFGNKHQKQEKKEEGYNKLDIIWSTKDNKQAMTIKCKFSFAKAF
jgi:hypothetical protein